MAVCKILLWVMSPEAKKVPPAKLKKSGRSSASMTSGCSKTRRSDDPKFDGSIPITSPRISFGKMRYRTHSRASARENSTGSSPPLPAAGADAIERCQALIGRKAYLVCAVGILALVWVVTTAFAAFSSRVNEMSSHSSEQSTLDLAPGKNSGSTAGAPNLQLAVQGWKDFVDTEFAGDQACQECHPREYEAHLRSGHSRTLTRMRDSAFAKHLIELGSYKDSRRDQTFVFTATEGKFFVRDTQNAPGITIPVTWLLGSGTHAQTPIAVDEAT